MKLRKNEILLFQGDSITDGARGRNQDLNHIMGHGYQYIVGARLSVDNIGRNIKLYNRGVSGNRVSDLYARWLEDTINLKPTMLSIMIGVNDAYFKYTDNSGSDDVRYEKIYRMLLDEVCKYNPDIRLVLMEPFVGECHDSEEKRKFFREYTESIRPVVKSIANDYNAAFVPLQDMFDEYSKIIESKELMWDGIHPTIIGHELIARQWLSCVEKKWN